jgi:hypothetical protein
MIASSAIAFCTPVTGDSRTGATGNEPAGGFYEGSDIFRIYHDDGTNDTAFALDENVNVNITTDRVIDVQDRNRLRVFDFQGNQIVDLDPAFTQTDDTAPGYSYEASFLTDNADFNADHYRLEVELRDSANERFLVADTLIVGGGDTPAKHIKTYTDASFTTEGWKFNENDIVYVEIWGNGVTADMRDSDINLYNYQDENHQRRFNQLNNQTVTTNGDYIRFAYDLGIDLNTNQITFQNGWWYYLEVDIREDGGGDVIQDWAYQIYIYDIPIPWDVQALPATVNRQGTATTTIFSEFSDNDAAGVDDFTITIQVREPDDFTVLTLVNAQTNGNGGLTVTALGGGDYNASYTWDPSDTQALGLYDLGMKINNTRAIGGLSDFGDNMDELEIFDTTVNPPTLIAGNTTAIPNSISRDGTATTVIACTFNDTDMHNADEFVVTMSVRDEQGGEILLVNAQSHGGAGEFGGTLSVVGVVGSSGYVASYTWDPPASVSLGFYDLYCSVTDPTNNTAEDIFDNNQDELELYQGAADPVIADVLADPAQIAKEGVEKTNLTVTFTDADNHPIDDFTVSFALRDPTGTPIQVATDIANGGAGAFGELLSITVNNTNYTAVIAWDPPDTAATGFYDLQARVNGPTGDFAESGWGENLDELEVTSATDPPEILQGDVTANPAIVGRQGTGSTTISLRFTDADATDATGFNVTLKVRDAGNNEYVLVDNKADGGDGEFGGTVSIRQTGNHFTADYVWDPSNTQPLGLYDLYAMVTDGINSAVDVYANNENELEITEQAVPLEIEIGNTRADPATVNRNGTSATNLIVDFIDPAVTDIMDFRVTFRVRSPSGTDITLAMDKRDGETGEGGGLVSVTNTTNGFQASVDWDPPADAELGDYDLMSAIKDPSVEVNDGFGHNLDELTIVDEPVAKVKDVKANPNSVEVLGTATSTILVEFSDPTEPDISSFLVTIKVKDPDGNVITLVNDKASGGAGEFGGQMTVTGATGEYTASYEWNPPDSAVLGMYDLLGMVTVAAGWSDESGFGANADELEVKAGTVVGEPGLADGKVTRDGKNWKFEVTYTNSKNLGPDSNGVKLIIGGQSYTMLETDPADTNYTDGKGYYFVLQLGEGTQKYHFEVTDASGQPASTEEKTVKVGEDTGEAEGLEGWYALVILLVLIIVVLIILLSKKGGGKEPEDKEPESKVPHVESKAIDEEKPEAKEDKPEAREPGEKKTAESEAPADDEKPMPPPPPPSPKP